MQKSPDQAEWGLGRHARRACWLLLALTLACNFAVRWHCLSVPLDRDEGEFAYGGQLMLSGELPYQSLYAMKLPGIYFVYAVIEAIAGQSVEGIHWGLLVVSTWNAVWVFLLGRELTDDLGGVMATIAYVALSLSRVVHPTAAQAEIFVLMLVLPGVWLLLAPASSWCRSMLWLASGLCFGAALVVKQHGAIFGLMAIAYLLAGQWTQRRFCWRHWGAAFGLFCVGFVLPYCTTVAWFYYRDALEPFWFWTVTYPRKYVTLTSYDAIPKRFVTMLMYQISSLFVVWMIGAIGLLMLIRKWWHSANGGWCLWFGLACALAILPGWYFRHHYFLFLLPFLALTASYALRRLVDVDRRPAAMALLSGVGIAILATGLATQSAFLLSRSPDEISVAVYGPNPFVDSRRLAAEIAAQLPPDGAVAVLGSEPQIPFYAGRRSATGHVYMYPLMEPQLFAETMQEQAIREIEDASPEFVLWVNDQMSWNRLETSNTRIIEWTEEYVRGFEPMMMIDIHDGGGSSVIQGRDLLGYQPLGARWMALYRRLKSRPEALP